MAFKLAVTKTVFGKELIFENAYHQVVSVTGNKNQVEAQITVYTDDIKEIVLDNKNIKFTPDSSDNSVRWDKQAYDYAKTLTEYKNAIDC